MDHNPLVSVSGHPMLSSFPVYVQAVEEFNKHADELMQMAVSASPGMAAMAPEIGQALRQYHLALKEFDVEKILSVRGDIYLMASAHGMNPDDLFRFHGGVDVYMVLTLILSNIEKKCVACLN